MPFRQQLRKMEHKSSKQEWKLKFIRLSEIGDKERIQKFKGLIIAMRWATPLTRMITVRADVDGIGIEKIFPINSPAVAKIEILRQFKVRRNNIGYIRELTWKAARLKEIK